MVEDIGTFVILDIGRNACLEAAADPVKRIDIYPENPEFAFGNLGLAIVNHAFGPDGTIDDGIDG